MQDERKRHRGATSPGEEEERNGKRLKQDSEDWFFVDDWHSSTETKEIRAFCAPRSQPTLCTQIVLDKPILSYRKTRGNVFRVRMHVGQRKLLLSTKHLLNQVYGRLMTTTVRAMIIVYAGAAPGRNIVMLLDDFPTTVWHLYDPACFQISDAEKTKYGDRLHIHRCIFTDQIAHTWNGKCDIFISDIRSTPPDLHADASAVAKRMQEPEDDGSREFEHCVKADMNAQMRWTQFIQAKVVSMLKCRFPYTSATSTSYLAGELHIQPWAPPASTESRLIIWTDKSPENKAVKKESKEEQDGDMAIYDCDQYNNWFYHHNNVRREWGFYAHDGEASGLDHCYDCAFELNIHKAYLKLQEKKADDRAAALEFERVTAFIQRNMTVGGHAEDAKTPMRDKRQKLIVRYAARKVWQDGQSGKWDFRHHDQTVRKRH